MGTTSGVSRVVAAVMVLAAWSSATHGAITYRFHGVNTECSGCGAVPLGETLEGFVELVDGTDTSVARRFDQGDVESWTILLPVFLPLVTQPGHAAGVFAADTIESAQFLDGDSVGTSSRLFEVLEDGSWRFYIVFPIPSQGRPDGCAPPPIGSRYSSTTFCAFDASGDSFSFGRQTSVVPVPPALWLMLGALGALGAGRAGLRPRRR